MKKSILFFPLIAIWLLMGSCDSDSDYSYSRPSTIDTDEIAEAVNEALREAFDGANFNDTIFNCDVDNSMMAITADSVNILPAINRIPEIKVNVVSNDNDEWYSLRREKNEQRTIVAIVSVVIPCVMVMVIAGLVLLFFYFRMRNRNKVIEAAIAANYQLPPEFYSNASTAGNAPADIKAAPADGTVPPPLPRNERLRVTGLRLVAIGLGIMIMLGVWGGLDAAVLGLIPLLIGASNLANYYNILK